MGGGSVPAPIGLSGVVGAEIKQALYSRCVRTSPTTSNSGVGCGRHYLFTHGVLSEFQSNFATLLARMPHVAINSNRPYSSCPDASSGRTNTPTACAPPCSDSRCAGGSPAAARFEGVHGGESLPYAAVLRDLLSRPKKSHHRCDNCAKAVDRPARCEGVGANRENSVRQAVNRRCGSAKVCVAQYGKTSK
jgi:hypothetical protein